MVITKTQSDETNTKYAQGGIAGVMDFDKDSFSKHIEDTLIAGDGLCDKHIVEIVVKEGVERIKEIIAWGASFDRDVSGDYALGKEGGHSAFRILHHKDVTGKEMEACGTESIHRFVTEFTGPRSTLFLLIMALLLFLFSLAELFPVLFSFPVPTIKKLRP